MGAGSSSRTTQSAAAEPISPDWGELPGGRVRYRRRSRESPQSPLTASEQILEDSGEHDGTSEAREFRIIENVIGLRVDEESTIGSVTPPRLSLETIIQRRARLGPIHRGPLMERFPPSARQRQKNMIKAIEAWGVKERPLMTECIEHTPREGGENRQMNWLHGRRMDRVRERRVKVIHF
jgi:hypothetical protein